MSPLRNAAARGFLLLLLCSSSGPASDFAFARDAGKPGMPTQEATAPAKKPTAASKKPTEGEILQQALDNSRNDRATLVHNLEEFLKTYPESPQRPQIYRALVEVNLQLRDSARATEYAERIIALAPEDMSMTLLTIQLLERNGDEAALRRAVNYSTRVLEYVQRSPIREKSPKISAQEWEAEQKRDQMSVLLLRGRLSLKLHDTAAAEKDFASSYAILPNASAAEQLGEIFELKKDWTKAIKQYALAFSLADNGNSGVNQREIREKLGNVWRLARGTEDGLGDYLLRTYDELTRTTGGPVAKRNASAKEPYEFTLRKAPDGSPFPLAEQKGKVLVLNFWATWCGPCRALEPHFEHVAAQFVASPDVLFLAADCDEDETRVPPYLQEEKPRTTVVFADGLDRLFGVNTFPTLIVLDRAGKISYRAEGFDPDTVEKELGDAIRRALSVQHGNSGNGAQGAKSTP